MLAYVQVHAKSLLKLFLLVSEQLERLGQTKQTTFAQISVHGNLVLARGFVCTYVLCISQEQPRQMGSKETKPQTVVQILAHEAWLFIPPSPSLLWLSFSALLALIPRFQRFTPYVSSTHVRCFPLFPSLSTVYPFILPLAACSLRIVQCCSLSPFSIFSC